jgi:hypothetical protein
MKRYLDQLITDIHKATLQVRTPHPLWLESEADPDNEPELEDMSYVEKYLYGDKIPVSDITGIDAALLPPPEKLNEDQQALLTTELEKLLQFFHFYPDFPETFPAHLRYRFIRNLWSESHVPLSFGENHIEFCDYQEDKCPFLGYCSTCSETEAEMKYDEACETGKDFDLDDGKLLPTPEQTEKWARENGMVPGNESGLENIFKPSGNYDPASDFTGGFFNDDGTPIDSDSLPVPGLCIVCKKYQYDDPEENFLCMMNRNDQRDDPGFQCGAFEKI